MYLRKFNEWASKATHPHEVEVDWGGKIRERKQSSQSRKEWSDESE
jgi:hypothetical protein